MTHLEAHDAAIDAAQAENRTYYVWEEGKGEWFYAPAGSPLIPSQAMHDLERVLPSQSHLCKEPTMAVAPLAYLKKELGFSLGEWQKLSESDKDTLKNWAIEEMNTLGMLG